MSPTKTTPAWVDLRRQDKADKIAAALRAAGIGPAQAVRLTIPDRHRIEQDAQLRPSREGSGAWRIAVEMLAGSPRERALCPTCKLGDPDGEPGQPKPHGHNGPCVR